MMLAFICLAAPVHDVDGPRAEQMTAIIQKEIERTQGDIAALARQLESHYTPRPPSFNFRDLDTRIPIRQPIDTEWKHRERILAQIAACLRRIEELGVELGKLEPEEDTDDFLKPAAAR